MASYDVRDAELARLSGSELVERLCTTCRRADYEATARVLDARDRRLAEAEAALAEAKKDLDARDRRLAKAEAALAEAKKDLDARDVRIAKAEAALAEAQEGLDARDRRLAKVKTTLAEAKAVLDARDCCFSQMQEELVAALAAVDALRENYDALKDASRGPVVSEGARGDPRSEGARGEPRSEDARRGPRDEAARPGGAIAAPSPAPRSEPRSDGPRGESRSEEARRGPRDEVTRPGDAIAAPSPAPRGEPRIEGPRGESRSEEARCGPRDEVTRPGDAIAAPSPAPRGERRAEVAEEKGPPVIDLCSSDDEGEEPEGSRGKVSGVSRKRKLTASEVIEEEGCRARVSWKRNAAASACLSDDEDDTLTLSQLLKKKRDGAQPGADGEPKNADTTRPLGDYLPEVCLVVKEDAIQASVGGSDEPNVATFVQERGNVKLREEGGMSRAILRRNLKLLSPQPSDSAVGNNSEKNFSKANHVGVRTARKEGSLENDLPKTPVITERPEIRVVGCDLVHGMGNGKSAGSGVSRAPPPGFADRTGSLPPGFAAMTDSQKNLSRADHGSPRTSGKHDSFAGEEEDTLAQLKNSSFSARKIVESARAGAVSPKGHTGSALLGCNMILGLEAIRKQEKTNGGGPNAKVLPGTNAIEERVRCGMVVEATREQDETKGLVHKRNTMPVTNGIGKKHVHLSSCQSRETNDGGEVRTSDKQLGSATLLPRDELHSGQTSVLSSEVTRNWKCEMDIFTSCVENKELCMQAACALYRQKKLMFQPSESGRSGSSGLCKSDAHRVAKLVEFLLDGDVQGPLKRTAEELVKHDSTGPRFLEKVVFQFHDQLFYIFKNKEDPYFC